MSATASMLVLLVLLVATGVATFATAGQHSPPEAEEAEALRYRRRPRGSRRGGRPGGGTRSAPPPPPPMPPMIPLPTPPSPPAANTPPLPLLPCNRSVVPIMVGPGAPPSSQPTTDTPPACLPTPPPSPPTPPTPPRCPRCPLCAWPPRPVFPFPPGKPAPGASSSGGLGEACVAPLAGLMTCGAFLTGEDDEPTPTPRSDCCVGLGAFLNRSSAAGGGDRLLRCLCPVILGEVNRNLPKPVDPVRMMYLPIACGVVLPPQALYVCFTGQQSPRFGSRVPALEDLNIN
ncbi:hypothetical protein U9M48_005585 [Paspalum notatum var. saurae]|uniref:Bifunctional inhibitor/plant lipid transfer protein/seed storage helical domain-containing protein n=1 Tax=Paspalum notatum var. saurae TaxID=547442 RepID=A0AAQ3SIN8_PASNO